MTARISYLVVATVIEMFGDWLKHKADIKELCECNSGDFGRIARELGVTPGDLDRLVRQGPHAADELPKMLKVLGIDEETIARTQPLVLRDMQRVCASCGYKRQCDDDLAAGTAAREYEEYCGNVQTIDALGAKDRRLELLLDVLPT